MIVDRYDPVNLFALVPTLTLEFEPELRELDRLLDDAIVQRVKADLAKRYPYTPTRGRHSTPVEVILRLLVVKRLYGWSYAETARFVADSLVLRQCCRVYLAAVPDDTTLLRWANLIGPKTVEQLTERVVALARARTVTRGRKLLVDSTVVETNIHYPTDSRLLDDGVRVLSRLFRRAKEVLGARAHLGAAAFRSRTRSVRRLTQQLHRVARRTGAAAAEELTGAYRTLIGIARATRAQAEQARAALQGQAARAAARLRAACDHVLPLGDRAIA